MRRSLRGVKPVVSGSHEGIKAAVAKVLKFTWQLCRVHFLRGLSAQLSCERRQRAAADDDGSITRLVGALLPEQNDEWQVQRRYLPLEGLQGSSGLP
jgi:Transposase, Mutator family